MVVGMLLSYWGGLFSGAMLVSGRVSHRVRSFFFTSFRVPQVLGFVAGDFFTDFTMGFITILHHHLGEYLFFFFQASQANPRVCSCVNPTCWHERVARNVVDMKMWSSTIFKAKAWNNRNRTSPTWNQHTLPETNSKSPWKWMVGRWSFPFGAFRPNFRCFCC